MNENKKDIEQSKDKKNNKSAVLKRIALCICIVALFGLAYFLLRDYFYMKGQQKAMDELKATVEEESLLEETAQEDDGANSQGLESNEDINNETTVQPTEEPTPEPLYNPYASLFEENEDMVAWIQIEDSKIDLPIVQTMEDEDEYLFLDFNGEYNVNGTLLMDTDSDPGKPSTNIIVHGHNMKSGEMFGDLDLYADEDYTKAHETITIYYENTKKEYQVMAVFYSQVYKKSDNVFKFYKFFEAENEEEFNNYYDNCKTLSLFDTEVEAEYGDEFLTLSTCSYQVENGRFVVVAKMINEEELVFENEIDE